MNLTDIIGTTGVSLLLIAFALNLFGFINVKSRTYILLNFVGAGIACYTSIMIDFIPFVILEGTWAVAAGVALIKSLKVNTG